MAETRKLAALLAADMAGHSCRCRRGAGAVANAQERSDRPETRSWARGKISAASILILQVCLSL